jgi:hypothetical protein
MFPIAHDALVLIELLKEVEVHVMESDFHGF